MSDHGWNKYDYGGRYFDLWCVLPLSLDPMAEKFPWLSPYALFNNNPTLYVDPDGRFTMATHSKMVATAFSSTRLNTQTINNIKMGASLTADLANMKNSAVHMDGMKGTKSIGEGYVRALYNFATQMKDGNYEMAGVALHTVADFYSHSNYISLYQQYATDNNLSMDINDIPTFSEAVQNTDLMNYIENNGGLETGTYGGLVQDMTTNDPKAHGNMNLDENKGKGANPYNENNPKGATMHDAAKAVAERELKKIAENYK